MNDSILPKKSGYMYNVGDDVNGFYHGIKYNGKVSNSRRYTMRTDQTELSIKLNEEITVYGIKRDSISFSVLDNGDLI